LPLAIELIECSFGTGRAESASASSATIAALPAAALDA